MMDLMMDRLDDLVESGEISEEEARWEMRMLEAETQQYMDEHFDMNGDPYEDFLGNPW